MSNKNTAPNVFDKYALSVEEVLNKKIDELERDNQKLAGQNAALKADNKLMKGLLERQRKTIVGYHDAIDIIHSAVKEVYHGE